MNTKQKKQKKNIIWKLIDIYWHFMFISQRNLTEPTFLAHPSIALPMTGVLVPQKLEILAWIAMVCARVEGGCFATS
jgi:hypothetical protein